MIVDGNTTETNSQYESDICILGAGVAGITLANELKEKFSKIIIVESGDEQYSSEAQALYEPEVLPKYYPDPTHSRLRMLGGTSNHWENNTSPLSPIDFEKRDWIPNSGWPISFNDLEQHYVKAAWYCGVGEDGYSTDYWTSHLDSTDLTKNSDILETHTAKYSTPPVRFFINHGQPLVKAANVILLKNSNVVDATFDTVSKNISSVSVVSNSGKTAVINSRVFIMCLGGIENARMLLVFNEKYENKLGNQGDNVGRYFMGHPTPRAAQLFKKEDIDFSFYNGFSMAGKRVGGYITLSQTTLEKHQTTNLRMPLIQATNYMLSDGISSYHVLADAIAKGDTPEDFGGHLFNLVSDIDMVIEAIARKQWSTKLFDSADEIGGFQMPMMMEQTPSRDNRVRLGNKVDRLGIKKILIDWVLTEEDRERVWRSLAVVANEIGALSLGRMKILKERSSRIWYSQLGFSSHHMGTTRMAEDVNKGVVDKDQRVFGTNNFFINGCSVFSTGGHVPPTLTIAALSLRLANYIKDEFNHD